MLHLILPQLPLFPATVCALLLVVSAAGACPLQPDDTTGRARSLLIRPRQFTPAQVLTGDTVSVDSTSKIELISAPGSRDYAFTPEQDSAFARMIRLGIPPGTLSQIHAQMYARGWEKEQKSIGQQPWQTAMKMLELPAEYFLPSDRERTMYAYGIAQSQHVPNLSPYRNPNPGIQIPLSSISAFFGLEEDVSPVMQYTLDFIAPVQIVVYSPQARIIATVFDGRQTPGKYRITWNGRDDSGRRMPPGDYISEVRIGNERYIRKRIVIK